LYTVEVFCKNFKLELAPTKCTVLSKTKSEDLPIFQLNGQELLTLDSREAMTYLGSPISGWKTGRMEGTRKRLERIQTEIEEVMRSKLSLNQKIIAIKRYIYPELDFTLMASDVSLKELSKKDIMVRGLIDKDLNSGNLPVPFFYTDNKDGGLGIPNLRERKLMMEISTLIKLVNSPIRKTADFFRMAIEDEATYRRVVKDPSGMFEEWKTEEGVIQQDRQAGTNGIATRANMACNKLEIQVRLTRDGCTIRDRARRTEMEESAIIELKGKQSITRLKRILRQRWRSNLCEMPLHGHSFRILKDSSVSNNFLRSTDPRNDNLIRFCIMARCNQLATPEILAKRTHDPEMGHCKICKERGVECLGSLMHILNGCRSTFQWFTWRHNQIEEVIVKELRRKFRNISIGRSVTLGFTNVELSDANKRLKPDLSAVTGNKLLIIEINCPYGASEDRNANDNREHEDKLHIKYKEKREKYKDLVKELKDKLDMRIIFIGVVVSSLGVIAEETMLDLIKLFGKREAKSIGKKLSYNALLGSAVVYYKKPPICFGDPRKCDLCEQNNNPSTSQQNAQRDKGSQQNQVIEATDQTPVVQTRVQDEDRYTDTIQIVQSESHPNTNTDAQEQNHVNGDPKGEEQVGTKETRKIKRKVKRTGNKAQLKAARAASKYTARCKKIKAREQERDLRRKAEEGERKYLEYLREAAEGGDKDTSEECPVEVDWVYEGDAEEAVEMLERDSEQETSMSEVEDTETSEEPGMGLEEAPDESSGETHLRPSEE